MLFGASIQKRPNGCYRLVVQRSRKQWPSLGFLLIVAESQDPLFDFLTFRLTNIQGGIIMARTRDTRFLGASYRKWYGTGELRRPADVAFDDTARMFWMIGNFGQTMPAGMEPSNWADAEKWMKSRVPSKVWRSN